MKKKIAIFDLTDCEGCETIFLSLKKDLLEFIDKIEILNWRLIDSQKEINNYDFIFIEGAVATKKETNLVKLLRQRAKKIVALGSCACFGGIAYDQESPERVSNLKLVYGEKYLKKASNIQSISDIIKVDYFLPGCPININELKINLKQILYDLPITPKPYPVCLECKSKENKCLLLKGQPCLGPITRGGCHAACTSYNTRCYGCQGLCDQPNIKAMEHALKNQGLKPIEIKKILSIFFH